MITAIMKLPNSPFLFTKSKSSTKGTEKTFSPPKTKKHELFVDCCSFLGVGLGFDEDFQDFNCASIALMDSDDGGDSITSEDVSMDADLSAVSDSIRSNDNPPSDEMKDNDYLINQAVLQNEEETRTVHSTLTTYIQSMKNLMEVKKVTRCRDEDEEPPLRIGLPDNLVPEETTAPEDDEESKTLNTRSTLKIPPSLDTTTLKLTPSLDTKTCEVTLAGLQLVDTVVVDTTEAEIQRIHDKPSHLRPHGFYRIERVPSLVDTSDNDNCSQVSSMSNEQDCSLHKGIDSVTGRKNDHNAGGKMIQKQLIEKRNHILKPWLRNKATEKMVFLRDSVSWPKEEPGVLSTTKTPTTQYAEACLPTAPMINPTISIDVTATTIGTDEEEYNFGDNVPFDEPQAPIPKTSVDRRNSPRR